MYYGGNDWRDFLAHNWGTSPEMKAKEKEYNARYYQEHKEEILERLHKRRYGGFDPGKDYAINNHGFEGGRYTDRGKDVEYGDAFNKFMDEHPEFDDDDDGMVAYTYESDWFKSLPAEIQKNIKAHNDAINENLDALYGTVAKYMDEHPELSEEQQNQLMKNLKAQTISAKGEYIVVNSAEDRQYVADLIEKSGQSSSSNRSSGSSNNSSNNSSSSSNNTTNNTSTNKKKPNNPASQYGTSGTSSRDLRWDELERRRRG